MIGIFLEYLDFINGYSYKTYKSVPRRILSISENILVPEKAGLCLDDDFLNTLFFTYHVNKFISEKLVMVVTRRFLITEPIFSL